MFSLIRRRLCYANVTATLALVFAMSGGALAASHYLVSSTSQISPKVLKALKGKEGKQGPAGTAGPAGVAGAKGETGAAGATGSTGPAGPAGPKGEPGAAGAAGAPGAAGKEGSPWTAGGTLPSGKTETGAWATSGPPGTFEAKVSLASFAIPLAAAPAVNFVGVEEGEGEKNAKLPAGCKGNYEKPGANPGNFCVFETEENEVTELAMQPTAVGVTAHVEVNTEFEFNASGTWAVTAK
jgi:collagen triple helix repeat protein